MIKRMPSVATSVPEARDRDARNPAACTPETRPFASRMCALAMVLFSCSAAAQAPAPPANTLWISAAHLLDVRSGKLIDNPRVLVRDGRIVQVSRGGNDDGMPADARRIDLPGMTLLPGLIDMHVHLDSDPSYGGYTGLQFSDRFWSMLAVGNAQKTLMAGFTTVRNVGADAWNDVGLRQAIGRASCRERV